MSYAPPGTKPPKRLANILRGVSRLRPLPGNTARLLKVLDEPSVTAGVVSELVALDQALTAYILRVANSASMGYLMSCASVSDAVMRLGFKQIRSLVLSTVASGPLSARLSGYRLGASELWYHSIAVASAAHWLGGVLRLPDPEKAYVAGLLHDIGKLILDQYVRADYQQMVNVMQKRKVPLWEVEKRLFGIDHAAVGGLVAEHWQFPAELADAIRDHHTPSLGRANQRLAAIVNLANALIPRKTDSPAALEGKTIHPEALHILKLGKESIARLQAGLSEAMFEYESRHPEF